VGARAVIVPEMEQFAKQYGFCFLCHALQHPNRKAGEERSFWTVETNFLRGRTFAHLADLNEQARHWATERMDQRPQTKARLIPAQLFQHESADLHRLPEGLTPPYRVHERITDQYGYVAFAANYYWVPGTGRDAIMEAAHERGDSPESFLRSVIRTEYESKRENARLQRRQRANIPEPWEIETFPFARQPTLDRQRVMSYYHSFEYMTKQRNLVWLGPTGCGKTGLATSFLLQALDRGYRGYFVTFPEWGSFLHNPHLTSALIDRLTENCHTINIKDGVSLRDKLPE
jgi:hypothetical protein